MMAAVGLEVCHRISAMHRYLVGLVKGTVKLETDELPHFGSETRISLETVLNEMSWIRLLLRVARKWSHYAIMTFCHNIMRTIVM